MVPSGPFMEPTLWDMAMGMGDGLTLATGVGTESALSATRPFVIPVMGLALGAVLLSFERTATVGKLVLYFGAQSFMNFYMSWLLKTSVTLPAGTVIEETGMTLEKDLTGCPAGIAMTALQQVVSFAIFWAGCAAAYFTPYRYVPKKLSSLYEVFCVFVFGFSFALNIASNNASLGYISIAVNLTIRSCSPLTTFLTQQVLALCKLYPLKPCRPVEIGLMLIGAVSAAAFSLAQIAGSDKQGQGTQIMGVLVCVAALLLGSLNFALKGVLGEMSINSFDTCGYMALPATLFLLPLVIFVEKPVPGEWPKVFGADEMTDLQILQKTWAINKTTVAWLLMSGVFSFVYNVLQFSIIDTLSPAATAFGSQFNKAALVFLTLLVPFLGSSKLPGPPYIYVIWLSVVVNIASFAAYAYLQQRAKQRQEGPDGGGIGMAARTPSLLQGVQNVSPPA